MTDDDIFRQVERSIKEHDFVGAETILLKTMKERTDKTLWLNKLAEIYYKVNMFERAHEAAFVSYNLNPQREETLHILCAVAGATGDRKAQMDWALKAVMLNHRSFVAFNNLGSALFSMGMFAEALIPFETAIEINPSLFEIRTNIGIIHNKLGNTDKAIEIFEGLRRHVASEKELRLAIEFYLSLEYLARGNIEEGWRCYEGGFSPRIPPGSNRSPRRQFEARRWKGQSIKGKRLLVWREQGVGDELMFMSCYADLAKEDATIIIECEPRLVEIFSKTFPNYEVRRHRLGRTPQNLPTVEDFDFHIPAGSLPGIYRNNLSEFPAIASKIYIDKDRRDYFMTRFGAKRDQTLVGICWRSGSVDPIRRKSYTDITDWETLLRRDGYRYVCLQYDDCDEEIELVRERYGVEIIKLPGIDLKNNFIDVAALMSCMDVVVSVGTAVVPLAGAVGVPTYLLDSDKSWTLLGADYPWYESVTPVTVPFGHSISEALAKLPQPLITQSQISSLN